jgi:eukaryotic-like serine/threonine-protein kinase
MSPEQAEGKKVDARSDIFSFGAVLYEMLTGRAAFARDSTSATTAAILRDDPAALPQLAPGLQRLIAHCLHKDPNRRYQSIADVKITLEDLEQQAAVAITGSRRMKPWLLSAMALAVITAGIGIAWLMKRPKPVQQQLPVTQITFDGRMAINPAISADGKYVAYASDRAGQGNLDIWVQALPTGEPVRLTKDNVNEDYPCFSPDGTKIAFRSDRNGGGIYAVPVLGGEPRLLAKNGTRPLYSPDGKYVLSSPLGYQNLHGAFITSADGGEAHRLEPWPEHIFFAIWSPDASRILYLENPVFAPQPTVWRVQPLTGGPAIVSYQQNDDRGVGTPLVWLPNNRILFSALSGDASNLWLAKLSPGDWKVTEPFERLTFGTGQITSASVASTGSVVFSSTIAPTRLWSFPLRSEGRASQGDLLGFSLSGGMDYFPSLSDTGKMAYLSRKSGKWDVWVRDLLNGRETWLATGPGSNPYWVSTVIKSDGSRVAYSICADWGNCSIFTVGAIGGVSERVCDHCGQVRTWSSDGAVMASQEVVTNGSASGSRISGIDPVHGRKTVFVEKRGMNLEAPDFSPDGHWIAFQEFPNTPERRGVEPLFIAPLDRALPVESARWIPVTGLDHFDAQPKWSRDGKMLYFTSNRDGSTCLWTIRLDSNTKKPIGEPFAVRHFHASPRQYSDAVSYPIFSVGLDRIVISLEQVQSDLWMMQLPDM